MRRRAGRGYWPRAIVALFVDGKPRTPSEIAAAIGHPCVQTLNTTLRRMYDGGQLIVIGLDRPRRYTTHNTESPPCLLHEHWRVPAPAFEGLHT